MSQELPLEIPQLHERLRRDFTGKIPEASSGRADEREKNFLSRALAAFAVHKLSGCGLDDAANAVIDGGGDGGIDAIHYEPSTQLLWVAQSKYFADGQGEPSLGDVAKFKEGLENLLGLRFEAFAANVEFARRTPLIKTYFDQTNLQVRAVLAYSGIHTVSDDRIRMFENLKYRFSRDSDYFITLRYNLTSIHAWLMSGDHASGVDVTVTIHQPARVVSPAPYEMYYGLISLSDLAALYKDERVGGKTLVAANIREYKGTTVVNDQIRATLRDEPHHFVYLNNGLTAYCSSIKVVPAFRGNNEQQRLELRGFSIVNGAQTLGSIARFTEADAAAAPDGFAFIKIISLERCEDERDFAKKITRCTNFQNRVGLRDFAALDPEQARIAEHLGLSGIHYHFKDSADAPDPDAENFNFDEALLALACLESDTECDLCARALSNRDSLRSDEPVYPPPAEFRSRYHRLFRTDRSARTVWRAVQTKRAVIEFMQASARAEQGRRKQFFENARWLALHLIFLRLRPERGNDLALSADELRRISELTNEVSEALWTALDRSGETRHPKTVFSAPGDCKRLKGATLAQLNQPTNAETQG